MSKGYKGNRYTQIQFTIIALNFQGGVNMRKSFTDESGKRHFIRCKNETDFEKKKAILETELRAGLVILDPNTIFESWAEKWLETYKRKLSQKTREDYKYRLDNFINPLIGRMKLKDIKSTHCQEILNDMTGYSYDRISKVKYTMSQIFDRAQNDRMILFNPANGLELPKYTPDGTRRSITEFERRITLKVIKNGHRASKMVLCYLYLGLRPQEYAALQGRHFKGDKILIEQALKSDGSYGLPKNNITRIIPVPQHIRHLFDGYDPYEFIQLKTNGKPCDKKAINDLWKSFKREMQIEAGCKLYRNKLIPPYPISDDLVPYCYRHTYCTDLRDAKIDIKDAKYLMGHKNLNTTDKIYTHNTNYAMDDVVEKMSKYHNIIGSFQ